MAIRQSGNLVISQSGAPARTPVGPARLAGTWEATVPDGRAGTPRGGRLCI